MTSTPQPISEEDEIDEVHKLLKEKKELYHQARDNYYKVLKAEGLWKILSVQYVESLFTR